MTWKALAVAAGVITALALAVTAGLTGGGAPAPGDVARQFIAEQEAHEHAPTGRIDPDVMRRVERRLAAADEEPDPTGRRGAGPRAIAHTGRDRPLVADEAPLAPRLFRPKTLAYEPTIGVAPNGWVFFQGQETNGVKGTGVVKRSRDRGSTWEDATPRLPSGQSRHQQSLDPYLHVDPVSGRMVMSDLLLPCQMLSSSGDGGQTWSTNVSACEQTDHQNTFSGPPVSSRPLDGRVIYNCAINGGVLAQYSTGTSCTKSLDGGVSFRLTGELAFRDGQNPDVGQFGVQGKCDGTTGHGASGPDGSIYLPRGWCGQPWVAISRDEGATWERVKVGDVGVLLGESGNQEHEAAVAAGEGGTVFYFVVGRNRRPYLFVSRDRGKTWGPPIDAGPPGLEQAALPAMALAPDGTLLLAYMGTSVAAKGPHPRPNDEYAETPWSGYVAKIQSPESDRRVFRTATINDPADPLVVGNCGPVRCEAEYDFIDVQAAPDGTPFAVFVDACDGPKTCDALGEAIIGRLDPVAAAAPKPAGAPTKPGSRTTEAAGGSGSSAPAAGRGVDPFCLPRNQAVGRGGVGAIRLGARQARVLAVAGPPVRSGTRMLRWCVNGGRSVTVLFDRLGGRVRAVLSTARGHRAGRLRPGSRAPRGARRIAPGVLARGSLLIGVRRGRVDYLAVADRALLRDRRELARILRRARRGGDLG